MPNTNNPTDKNTRNLKLKARNRLFWLREPKTSEREQRKGRENKGEKKKTWEVRTPGERTIPTTQAEATPLMADFQILNPVFILKARKFSLITFLAFMKLRYILLSS